MNWEGEGTAHQDCVVFPKVNEDYGGLSNMSNDFPLVVDGVRLGSSEALYQACRFPQRPDWQREVLDAPHAMRAKMAARKEGRRKQHTRADWERVQEAVMRWCLRVKLAQHFERFGGLLRRTSPQYWRCTPGVQLPFLRTPVSSTMPRVPSPSSRQSSSCPATWTCRVSRADEKDQE
jgi:predicted NAD-dependent protein-ADP-ribosyltransferase YbiA (DUF1768 family)